MSCVVFITDIDPTEYYKWESLYVEIDNNNIEIIDPVLCYYYCMVKVMNWLK